MTPRTHAHVLMLFGWALSGCTEVVDISKGINNSHHQSPTLQPVPVVQGHVSAEHLTITTRLLGAVDDESSSLRTRKHMPYHRVDVHLWGERAAITPTNKMPGGEQTILLIADRPFATIRDKSNRTIQIPLSSWSRSLVCGDKPREEESTWRNALPDWAPNKEKNTTSYSTAGVVAGHDRRSRMTITARLDTAKTPQRRTREDWAYRLLLDPLQHAVRGSPLPQQAPPGQPTRLVYHIAPFYQDDRGTIGHEIVVAYHGAARVGAAMFNPPRPAQGTTSDSSCGDVDGAQLISKSDWPSDAKAVETATLVVHNRYNQAMYVFSEEVPLGWVAPHRSFSFSDLPAGFHHIYASSLAGDQSIGPMDWVIPGAITLEPMMLAETI